jgi:hypothetical protein
MVYRVMRSPLLRIQRHTWEFLPSVFSASQDRRRSVRYLPDKLLSGWNRVRASLSSGYDSRCVWFYTSAKSFSYSLRLALRAR